MAVFSPITDWIKGQALSAGLLNSKINTPLRELQAAIPRSLLADLTGAQTDCNTANFVVITGLSTQLSVDSPRTLQANFQVSLTASATGVNAQVISRVNGATSGNWQSQFTGVGGAGQQGASSTGFAVAVPAGTVTVDVVMRIRVGSGTITSLVGSKLQVVDLGPA